MDSYLDNNFSSSQGESVTFGEYKTTTKVNGVLSKYTPSIDAIPNAEFGNYQKTTFEISSDYNQPNMDILKASGEGNELAEFQDSTDSAGFETNFDTKFDILQATSSTDEGAQFGEYRTTTKVDGKQSIYTPSIDAKPSAEIDYTNNYISDSNFEGEKFDQNFEGEKFDQNFEGEKFDQNFEGEKFDQNFEGEKFDQNFEGEQFDQNFEGEKFD